MTKAIVLAAGLGERLRPLTNLVPKPFLPTRGGLVIEHVFSWLRRQGISEIYVVLAYMADKVLAYLGGAWEGVKFLVSNGLLGTAGQLGVAKGVVGDEEDFIAVNGDVLTNVDLGDALRFHRESMSELTIVARELALDLRFGVLRLGEGGRLIEWLEKPSLKFPVASGIYIIKGSVLNLLGNSKVDMNEFVSWLVQRGHRVYAYVVPGEYVDIGTPADYLRAYESPPLTISTPPR